MEMRIDCLWSLDTDISRGFGSPTVGSTLSQSQQNTRQNAGKLIGRNPLYSCHHYLIPEMLISWVFSTEICENLKRLSTAHTCSHPAISWNYHISGAWSQIYSASSYFIKGMRSQPSLEEYRSDSTYRVYEGKWLIAVYFIFVKLKSKVQSRNPKDFGWPFFLKSCPELNLIKNKICISLCAWHCWTQLVTQYERTFIHT